MNYKPIGIIHTDYTPETGAPRQGILVADNSGTIEIFPEYRQALTTLDSFEYIIPLHVIMITNLVFLRPGAQNGQIR